MERTRLERKRKKANLEELNFSRIDLKSAAKSRQATKVGYDKFSSRELPSPQENPREREDFSLYDSLT